MMARQPARARALKRLEAFIGEWLEEVEVPRVPAGRMSFEWALDRQILIQRSEIPHPDFPDSVGVIAVDPAGAYLQHYFDSRGLSRVYKMRFENGAWTLLREQPDFAPLDFSQRFLGTFTSDGRAIAAAWESSADGTEWKHDFNVNYTKIEP